MSPGEPAAGSAPASGWRWAARLGGFVAVVFGGILVVSAALVLLGAPATVALDVWNVLPGVAVVLLASWWFTRLEHRTLASLGLPGGVRMPRELGLGWLAGVALIGLVVVTLILLGWLSWTPEPGPGSRLAVGAGLTVLLLGAAFVEELLFRGYPFQVLERRFGAATAIAATSVIFGAVHALNPNFAALPAVNITLAGFLLAIAYWRTRSLWFVTGLHLGWNWTMALSELSVSGLPVEMPGYESRVTGPVLWTGGAFGPEGGLLVTVASLLGIVWMWRWRAEGESLSRHRDRRTDTGRGGSDRRG